MNIVARTGHFVASALMFLAAFRVFRAEWLVGDGVMVYIVSGLFLALGIHHLSMSQRRATQQGHSLPPSPIAGQGFPGQGFPGQGLPAQGFPAQGFPAQGLPAQGYGYPPADGQYGYPPPPPRWPGGTGT
jgi:hypothetical protein